jgi:hypothetical protein
MSRPPPPSSPRPEPSVASPIPLYTRGTERSAGKGRDAFRVLRRTTLAPGIHRSVVAPRKATRFPAICGLDSGSAKPKAPKPPCPTAFLPEARGLHRISVASRRSSRNRSAQSNCGSTPALCNLRCFEPLTLAPRNQRGLNRRISRPWRPRKPSLLAALDTRLLTAAPKIVAGDPGGSFGPVSGAKRPLQWPW